MNKIILLLILGLAVFGLALLVDSGKVDAWSYDNYYRSTPQAYVSPYGSSTVSYSYNNPSYSSSTSYAVPRYGGYTYAYQQPASVSYSSYYPAYQYSYYPQYSGYNQATYYGYNYNYNNNTQYTNYTSQPQYYPYGGY